MPELVCSMPGCTAWPAKGYNVCGEHLHEQQLLTGATRPAQPVFTPDQVWEQIQRAAINHENDSKEERDAALREAGLKK